MAEPHDWPFEQPARRTLRPWYLTAASYLVGFLADYHYVSLRYYGDKGVKDVHPGTD